ncbi:uncharacterized protein LOC123320864 isoform X1 [Coccinella septempunctata]|uniref:uncharacterized protein LOC123320864 isoform X1 n=1 Tax=Coccinella septempunctata TaxID=41139 RepID=UPI001D06C5B2|nr:uncharacterized protein LOC123320864 isoform X1 [Coccinella septempunctata]
MVKTCRNNKNDFPKLSFFSLPKKMEIALKWMEFAGRNDNDLDKEYTMCSEHFIESQFKTVIPRKLLYTGSIPCNKGPHAMKSVNENDALNTDGSSFTDISDEIIIHHILNPIFFFSLCRKHSFHEGAMCNGDRY